MAHPAKRAATVAEFRTAVEREFGFLRSEHGFALEWDAAHPFEATFRRGALAIRVEGAGYGFAASMSLWSAGERLPWIFRPLHPMHAPATGVPQLDEVREWASRLRREGAEFLAGDLSAFEMARRRLAEQETVRIAAREADPQGTFFGRADKLWKNGKGRELVELLDASPYPLSAVWRERLDDARRKL